MVPAVSKYIIKTMGEKFTQPPPFDLLSAYNDSNVKTPLIFVLSPGSDPFGEFQKLAEKCGKGPDKEGKGGFRMISLGQGQGVKAEKFIDESFKDGNWVILQNCHLSVSWMPKLEKIIEETDPKKVNSEYRLWLTS